MIIQNNNACATYDSPIILRTKATTQGNNDSYLLAISLNWKQKASDRSRYKFEQAVISANRNSPWACKRAERRVLLPQLA